MHVKPDAVAVFPGDGDQPYVQGVDGGCVLTTGEDDVCRPFVYSDNPAHLVQKLLEAGVLTEHMTDDPVSGRWTYWMLHPSEVWAEAALYRDRLWSAEYLLRTVGSDGGTVFTWEDVEALRVVADVAAGDGFLKMARTTLKLADRIASLLPPEES